MSSPERNLGKGKKTPLLTRCRIPPYKHTQVSEDNMLSDLQKRTMNTKIAVTKDKTLTDIDMMSSMMQRLTIVEKKLQESERSVKEKDKRIHVLEEKCEIYRKAQGYGCDQVVELEKKCHQLQKQIHSMEDFLEDYGMIWVGGNDSSDDEKGDEELEAVHTVGSGSMWNPGLSVGETSTVVINFDLVLKNVQELNQIAGEGEHFIKHTKDGAKLQLKESVPLVLYQNGIFMFNGPFRPYLDVTTQRCMQDLMDGYFPSELQDRYPDGIPFRVEDKRDTFFCDKRLEKFFPGEGYALSPGKNCTANNENMIGINKLQKNYTDINSIGQQHTSVESFLNKLPFSIVKNDKIIDVRNGLKESLIGNVTKNDVIVVDTAVVDDIKTRLSSNGRRSRPQSSVSDVTTLRIKSETGDQTYILKMRHHETIADVRRYLQSARNDSLQYELKTSFPNQTYTDDMKTLRDYNLVPNATLHLVAKK